MFSPLARAGPGWLHNQSPALWRPFFHQSPPARVRRNFGWQPDRRLQEHGPSIKQRRGPVLKKALSFAMVENNRRTARSHSPGRAPTAFVCSLTLERRVPFWSALRATGREPLQKLLRNVFASVALDLLRYF